MDGETIAVLRTVCVAGRIRSGFNGDCNARLEQLVKAGFLAVVELPHGDRKRIGPQRSYRPTESGLRLSKKIVEEGLAAAAS
jgi:hypothetical protein